MGLEADLYELMAGESLVKRRSDSCASALAAHHDNRVDSLGHTPEEGPLRTCYLNHTESNSSGRTGNGKERRMHGAPILTHLPESSFSKAFLTSNLLTFFVLVIASGSSEMMTFVIFL